MSRAKINCVANAALLCALTLALPAAATPRARAATDEEARMAILCVRDAINSESRFSLESWASQWREFEYGDELDTDVAGEIDRWKRSDAYRDYHAPNFERPRRCAPRSAAEYEATRAEPVYDPEGFKARLDPTQDKWSHGTITFLTRPTRRGYTIFVRYTAGGTRYEPPGMVDGKPYGGESYAEMGFYIATLRLRRGAWVYARHDGMGNAIMGQRRQCPATQGSARLPEAPTRPQP